MQILSKNLRLKSINTAREVVASFMTVRKAMPGSFPGSAKYVQTMPLPEDTEVDEGLVPYSDPVCDEDVDALCDFFNISKKLVVLTGAGISTECGIPDYRSPNGPTVFEQLTCENYMPSMNAKKRCWAYSSSMWRKFKEAKPGPAHTALASLEKANRISLIITQNIDGLHQRVGSNVCDLLGTVHNVTCDDCRFRLPRDEFEDRMNAAAFNPEWEKAADKPDLIASENNYWDKVLCLPPCPKCNGVLKPDSVLCERRIPHDEYYRAKDAFEECHTLLVLGTTLSHPDPKLLTRAAEVDGVQIAIVNIGETRCDDSAELKIDARVGEILPRVLEKLGVPHITDFEQDKC